MSRLPRATPSPASRASPSRRSAPAGRARSPAATTTTRSRARRPIRLSRTTCARRTAPGSTRTTSRSPSPLDSTAPSVTAPSVTAGFYTALSVAVALNGGTDGGSGVNAGSSVVERDEAPLDNGDGSCDAFPGSWSTVTLSGGNDTTVVSGKCYRYRELLTDRVGNQGASGASTTAKVDTSAPAAPSLSYGSLANAAVTGDTVYFRPSAGNGQFQVTASCDRRAVGHRLAQLPGGGLGLERLRLGQRPHLQPHRLAERPGRAERRPRSRTAPASPRPPPASRSRRTPAHRAASPLRSPAATTRRSRSRSRSTTARTRAPASTPPAASSSATRLRSTTATAPATPSRAPGRRSPSRGGNDTTVASGKCYRYRYLLSDRVGNQATSGASATAKVDTSAPAAPGLSYGSLSNAVLNLGVVYYLPSAASGQFAVTAASTDGQSGVASYGFPAAASGWSVSGSGDTRTYSHSGSPADPAEPNDVTAVNGAGLTSGATSFTVTPDASAADDLDPV